MSVDRLVAHDLTQGSVCNHIVRLSMPMMLGILAIMSMYLVDTFYVAQLGKEALAAIGFVFPLINILNALAFGVGAGTASLVARNIGAGHHKEVRAYVTHALLLSVLMALCFAVLFGHFNEAIFTIMGASPEVLPLINDYTNIWLLGCFLIVVPMVGNSAIRAAGDTRVPSFIMLSVALVNIILDPIFIFGLFGFPRLELKGAALATIVAYAISFVLAIFFLKYRLNLIDFSCFRRGCVRSWQAICSLAVPVTVTNLIAPLAATLSLWLISDFGTSAVAGYSIAARMETFAMVPILAVASVMGALAGQNYGAGHLDRTNFAIKKGHQFVVIWGLLVATIFWVFRVELIGLFSEEPLVLETASIYLKLVPLGYLFVGLTMITSGALTGVGFPVYGLLLTVSRLIILYCPLALILKNFLDVQGIFLAMLIANIVIGCCALKLIQLSKLQLN